MALSALVAIPSAEASHFRGVDMWASIDSKGVVTLTARTRWRKDLFAGIDSTRFGETNFSCSFGPSTPVSPATGMRITRVRDGAVVYTFALGSLGGATSHEVSEDTSPPQYSERTQVFVLPLGATPASNEAVGPMNLAPGEVYEISWNDWSRVTGIRNVNTTDVCGGLDSGFGGRVRVVYDGTASSTPSLTSTFLNVVARGFDYVQNLNAASPQGFALTYRFANLNPHFPDFGPASQVPGLTLDTASGLMKIPAASTSGLLDNALAPTNGADYMLHVEVTDSHGGMSVRDGVLDAVTSNNHPPTLDPIGDQTITVGQPLAFNVHATDVDSGQTLTLKATGLPAGAAFTATTGPNTGVTVPFSWTPTPDQVGVVCANFEATDSGTAAASNTDTLTAQERVCFTVVPAVKATCASTTLTADPGTCGATAACSCQNGSLVGGQPTFTGTGAFSYSCTCSDGANTDTCTGTLNVIDQTAPQIACPADVTTECTGNAAASAFAGAASGTDACSAPAITEPGPAMYPLGTTTVTHTATDGSNNVASCTNKVTVVDTTPPAIACPGPISTECTANQAAPVTPPAATASDVCTTVSLTSPAAGNYPLGTTSVSYTARDASGNTSSCATTIAVVDTTPPSLACPGPVVAECTGDKAASVVPAAAIASDTCSTATITAPSAGRYPLGTTGVVYTAHDGSGNAAQCQSTISIVDTTPPQISCPAPITAECTADGAATLTPPAALAQDVCSNVSITGPAAGSFALGSTVISYTATDESLNASGCTTTIDVVDTTAPSITCPAPITAECTANGAATVTPGIATAADTCSAVSVDGPATTNYPLGTTSVTYTATDSSHNASSCSSTIAVVDTTAPVITVAPGTATQYAVGSCASGALSLPVMPTAVDACQGQLPVTCTTVPGTSFGANDVTCTATDASGNTSTVTLSLVVMQPLKVVFDAPLVGGGTVTNRFTVGQTVVHKVRLLDCSQNDVTATAAVTVHLDVQLREAASGGNSTEIVDVPTSYNGVGDSGSQLVLVSGDYQYNLSTTGYQAGTQSNSDFYESTVSVEYRSVPALTVGSEVAHLESK